MSFLGTLLTKHVRHTRPHHDKAEVERYKRRMHQEASIGGALFGPVAEGGYREFFCLDERTWIWHEAWQDSQGKHAVTTRYDVRPDGVFKTQGASEAAPLDDTEARNLYLTVMAYCDRVLGAAVA